MKPRTILLISLISLLVIGAAGYYGFSAAAQEPPTPQASQTAPVTICDVQQTVDAPGELDNTSETQLLMPVDGKLAEVSVQAGESVSVGAGPCAAGRSFQSGSPDRFERRARSL